MCVRAQVGCGEECVVGAHSSARWALPEPEGARALAVRAPGGPRTALALSALGDHHQLLYQNFIYVAFLHSRHRSHSSPFHNRDTSVLLNYNTDVNFLQF